MSKTGRQADRVVETRRERDFLRDRDQVLVAHELGNRCCHLGSKPRRERRKRVTVRNVGEQPVAKGAEGEGAHRGKCGPVVRVEDQSRDFVVLVGNESFAQKCCKRQIGESHPRRDAFFTGLCRQPREPVT